jgi:hypothetical protein
MALAAAASCCIVLLPPLVAAAAAAIAAAAAALGVTGKLPTPVMGDALPACPCCCHPAAAAAAAIAAAAAAAGLPLLANPASRASEAAAECNPDALRCS